MNISFFGSLILAFMLMGTLAIIVFLITGTKFDISLILITVFVLVGIFFNNLDKLG